MSWAATFFNAGHAVAKTARGLNREAVLNSAGYEEPSVLLKKVDPEVRLILRKLEKEVVANLRHLVTQTEIKEKVAALTKAQEVRT